VLVEMVLHLAVRLVLVLVVVAEQVLLVQMQLQAQVVMVVQVQHQASAVHQSPMQVVVGAAHTKAQRVVAVLAAEAKGQTLFPTEPQFLELLIQVVAGEVLTPMATLLVMVALASLF
jgi:hypothetical protein